MPDEPLAPDEPAQKLDEAESSLVQDPVFQLNTCLWLVRRSPLEGRGAPDPVLTSHGFELRALSLSLAAPPSSQRIFAQKEWKAFAPEPDVVHVHSVRFDHLVMECKARGFGIASSNVSQARKLLAFCVDSNFSLGTAGVAPVVYVIPEEDAPLQQETLGEIADMLAAAGCPSAPYGTLGLEIDDDGLWGNLVIDFLPEDSPIEEACGSFKIKDSDGGDARPLYIVPFDPAAADNQADDQRRYCGRMLAERICNETVSLVGNGEFPGKVTIDSAELLAAATFNVSRRWDASELQKFRAKISTYVGRQLRRSGRLQDKVTVRRNSVTLVLDEDADQRAAIDILMQRGEPERLKDSLLDLQQDAAADRDFDF